MKKQPSFQVWLQCAIVLLSFSSLQAQWEFIGSPETGHPLHYAYSTERMYMVSKAGLFYSENEGNSWNNIPLPDSIIFFNKIYEQNGSLYLVNSNENWYPDIYSTAYRSDDNGQTWKSIYPPGFDPISGWELKPAIKGDTVVY
ncbi:MAG TPA: hypothetical protein VLA46_03300, partial [Saprospiraceae bacterium]|nr:hypothetical protein [Saprospiraceae bacterium]